MEEVIINSIVEYFGDCSIDDIKGHSRKKELVWRRRLAVFFVRAYCGHTLKYTGYIFNNRDHTTVINSIDSVINAVSLYKDNLDSFMGALKIIHDKFDSMNYVLIERSGKVPPAKRKNSKHGYCFIFSKRKKLNDR